MSPSVLYIAIVAVFTLFTFGCSVDSTPPDPGHGLIGACCRRPGYCHTADGQVVVDDIEATNRCVWGDVRAPEVPGQAEAVSTILTLYGAPSGLRGPAVRWKTADLDCATGTGWMYSALDRPTCIRGLYDTSNPGEVVVAFWPSAELAQVSLAHELLHAISLATTGDPNPGHTGDFLARVESANQALWKAVDAAFLAAHRPGG